MVNAAAESTGAQRPVAVVVGPPGAGKTTVGQALAARLGVAFHDVDAAIEAAQGRSVSDIFVDDGEPAFRDLERAEVARSLSEESGVVSVGGGAVMDPLTEAALALARARDERAVFLLTTTADRFFPRFGFERITREDVPESVRQSIEFESACPASAIVMRKLL